MEDRSFIQKNGSLNPIKVLIAFRYNHFTDVSFGGGDGEANFWS